VVELPFKETLVSEEKIDTVIRIFGQDIEPDELKWHWDDEDRVIYPVNETDWMFQFDNQLPEKIDNKIKISKGVWHRIIKGTGNLEIIVEKIKDI
jgi:hypothetical protein